MSSAAEMRSADTSTCTAENPTFRSGQFLPLPRPRRISSSRSDGVRPAANFSSPTLSGGSLTNLKDERTFENKWNVSEEWRCLPQVPPLYVLGARKTVVEEGNSNPAVVACRISDCLRLLSLDALYDHSRALVTSCDGVKFFVRLFRNAGGRGTIVEIQRKRGSALRFHGMARSVLRAARGETTTPMREAGEQTRKGAPKPDDPGPRPSPMGESPLLLCRSFQPASQPSQTYQLQLSAPPMFSSQDHEYSIEAALETADDLLRKDRADAQELGMESLALLTDEESSGMERALGVARVLLMGLGGGVDGYASMWHKILDLIFNSRVEEQQETEMDSFKRHHKMAMRRLAVKTLGNCLSILSRKSPALVEKILAGQAGLLPVLMEDVERAKQSPHDAALAVRCLSALLSSGSATVMACKAMDETIREKLATARGVGRCRHSTLEKESERALLRLL